MNVLVYVPIDGNPRRGPWTGHVLRTSSPGVQVRRVSPRNAVASQGGRMLVARVERGESSLLQGSLSVMVPYNSAGACSTPVLTVLRSANRLTTVSRS